ncbi:hypothetical protein D9M68_750940 [compost metagenome]
MKAPKPTPSFGPGSSVPWFVTLPAKVPVPATVVPGNTVMTGLVSVAGRVKRPDSTRIESEKLASVCHDHAVPRIVRCWKLRKALSTVPLPSRKVLAVLPTPPSAPPLMTEPVCRISVPLPSAPM